MLATIIVEVILGIVALMAGSFLWQGLKRDRFLKRAIHDMAFLSQLISRHALDAPSAVIEPFLARLPPGYALNIQLAIRSDTAVILRIKIILGSIVLAALIASYFVGVPYLLINTAIFLFSAAARLSQSARKSAEQQILTVATILDRWHSEDANDCDKWIKQAWSLRPLYDAVISAREAV